MRFRTTATALIITSVILVSVLVHAGNATQQLPPQTDRVSDRETLRDILFELRKLNQSLKHSSIIANKTQITLSLIQVRQNQVDRTTRQLQNVRAEIESAVSQN